ncbi:MAG: PQQ-binding-like beta-propeller repeat protein [Planctomycetes bacterium]|nr:PQQ-binding-like beta-propeller repeat protein [Planctomycetota bacterium]
MIALPRVARLVIVFAVLPAASALADWPEFRGPTGQGHSDAADLPLTWSEKENVVWKTAIPGRGWSSPVEREGRIWMTTAIETPATPEQREKKLAEAPNPDGLEIAGSVSMRAVCVDFADGRLLHDIELFHVEGPDPVHSQNSFASPTPVLDEGKVYVHFGTYGSACLDDKSGKVVWTNRELKCDHQNGPGSSPIIWRDLFIVHCDGIDVQYVAALDKATGKLAWKTGRSGELNEREPLRKAYCTPLVVEHEGRPLLISPGADWVYGYDPAAGKELWRASYGKLGFSNVPRPVVGHGMIYISTCFVSPSMLAVRYDGAGDVSDTHLVWRNDRQAPRMPSPLLVGDELYIVSDNGVATCLDARTGDEHWARRLGGNFSASPLYADGRIYFSNREGTTFVLAPGREFKLLAENMLDGGFYASPAVVEKSLILRTDKALYRIEEARPSGE